MDESGFRNWLALRGVRPKMVSDMVCRLKALMRATGFDIDEQYIGDSGEFLISLFRHRGENSDMKRVASEGVLPIGRPSLATYKLAVAKYFLYLGSR